jgi:hypothetical protein
MSRLSLYQAEVTQGETTVPFQGCRRIELEFVKGQVAAQL